MSNPLFQKGPTGSFSAAPHPKLPASLQLGHLIPEWFGWEGTLDLTQCHGQDAFHQPRLLPSPAQAGLGHCQGLNQIWCPLCRRELPLCPRALPPGGARTLGLPLYHPLHAGGTHHTHPHLHHLLHDSSAAPGELGALGGLGWLRGHGCHLPWGQMDRGCPCQRCCAGQGIPGQLFLDTQFFHPAVPGELKICLLSLLSPFDNVLICPGGDLAIWKGLVMKRGCGILQGMCALCCSFPWHFLELWEPTGM